MVFSVTLFISTLYPILPKQKSEKKKVREMLHGGIPTNIFIGKKKDFGQKKMNGSTWKKISIYIWSTQKLRDLDSSPDSATHLFVTSPLLPQGS